VSSLIEGLADKLAVRLQEKHHKPYAALKREVMLAAGFKRFTPDWSLVWDKLQVEMCNRSAQARATRARKMNTKPNK
jgi:hypothetical protein